MLPERGPTTSLDRAYLKFLAGENSAEFVEAVAADYTLPTLEKLLRRGAATTRRAAALAVGFLGDFDNNEALGQAFRDSDRGVRLLADHGIRQLWFRVGGQGLQQGLMRAAWWNRCSKYEQALEQCAQLIDSNPDLAEAWNQRAVALAGMNDHQASVLARSEALYLNRFHFVAAAAMAGSYLQLDEMSLALDSFRLALQLNPDLENVRKQIGQLERIVGG